MKRADLLPSRIYSLHGLLQQAAQWRVKGKTIAFTNGVFDILHPGHIFSLSQAAKEAEYLVVGLNSDASVKRLKGVDRPVNNQDTRSLLLASLVMVDAVVLFEEDTPLELISALQPDILVKGGDYTENQVVGALEVKAGGGKVIINPLLEGYSTTRLIELIRSNSPASKT